MMGVTHLDAYRSLPNVQLVAICDADPQRLSGQVHAAGNIEGQSQSSVANLPSSVRRCSDVADVIGLSEIDLVDICLPTDLHHRFGLQVLEAGQHLLIEKPLARTSQQAAELVAAAQQSKGLSFVAHCLRFWPGWSWLKEVIDDGRFGNVHSATFRRVVNHPGGPFYSSGDRSGGAALDLHIHDTDFVQYLFGMPKSVTSFGYSKITNQPDHIVTSYEFDDVPLVVAEGGWAMADGFVFNMGFTVNFDRATAEYNSAFPQPLKLYEQGKSTTIELSPKMGYNFEIEYFIDCIEKKTPASIVTLRDGLNTVKIIEAEVASLRSGRKVVI
jgi:predicted dehydrogenase